MLFNLTVISIFIFDAKQKYLSIMKIKVLKAMKIVGPPPFDLNFYRLPILKIDFKISSSLKKCGNNALFKAFPACALSFYKQY